MLSRGLLAILSCWIFLYHLTPASAALLLDRGLPVYNDSTPNLNNAAGVNRCNITPSWTSSTPPTTYRIGGDDFIIGTSGRYRIDTVRVWINFGDLANTSPPNVFPLKLIMGPAGGELYHTNTSIRSATRVYYSNGENYQETTGDWKEIWQVDLAVNRVVEGGKRYVFFIDGFFQSSYDNQYYIQSLHASNAALSNSPQQGADNKFLWLNVTVNGSAVVLGTIDEQTSFSGLNDKPADGNVQIFGERVADQGQMVLNRGLPVYNPASPNLNEVALANRCNIGTLWSSVTYPTSYPAGGDSFVIGRGGSYRLDTVRLWAVFGNPSNTYHPYPLKLWVGPEGGPLQVISTTYSLTRVRYSNGQNYQRASSVNEFREIWQVDFVIDQEFQGGKKYFFFLDGLYHSTYDNVYYPPSLHLSNAALSNTTQQGADNIYYLLNLTSVDSVWLPGAITPQTIFGGTFNKPADANVQLFGTRPGGSTPVFLLLLE